MIMTVLVDDGPSNFSMGFSSKFGVTAKLSGFLHFAFAFCILHFCMFWSSALVSTEPCIFMRFNGTVFSPFSSIT